MKQPDDIDRAIIAQLALDGRLTNREVARRLEISEGTVRSRLKRLRDDQIIRLNVVVDPRVDGYGAAAYLGLRVKHGHVASVCDALRPVAGMSYIGRTIGPFDVMALLLAADLVALRDCVTREISALEGVEDVEILPIVKTYLHAAKWANITG